MNILASTTTFVARLLPPTLSEPVLGDLAESGTDSLDTLLELLSLVAHKSLEPWRSWHPWLASAFALSGSLLLLGASFGLSMNARPLLQGTSSPALWPLALQALLLVLWAWTTAFVVASLSRSTAFISALLCIIPSLSCVLRFREPSLSRLCVLLFLAPAILGSLSGLRRRRLSLPTALILFATTGTVMPASPGHHIANFLLFLPACLLVATAAHDSRPHNTRRIALAFVFFALVTTSARAANTTPSQLVAREIQSTSLRNNKLGISATRRVVIYLPPGYDASSAQRYPVIYFFPNPLDSSFRDIFDKQNAQHVLDAAIAFGLIRPVLFVVPDMTTPLGSTWYVNSPVTGNWDDFIVRELVPYIDSNFRTLAARDSRGIAGTFMGAHGAIRLAMLHPEVFGSVYGLHPVGTGNGVKILAGLPNWDLMENAKTLDDVRKDGYSTIFTSIFQAHVPNPNSPPLYIDFPAHRINGQLVIDPKVMDRMRENFFLESLIGKYADNLRSLRALKFDWARSDLNWDHVYSNQAFTHKLNEYGIPHEAEEYNGTWNSDPNWSPEGRITTDLLPFFQRHLVF